RLHLRDVVLDVALAATHTHFQRLLRDRHVREYAHPDLTAALHVAGHRTASGLELARGHTGTARRLQAVVAERDVIAALRKAGIATFELLAILGAFGLHHVRYLRAGPSGLLGYWLSGQIANSPVDQLAVTQAVASAGAA